MSKEVIRALDELGLEQPSRIQATAIPLIVEEPYNNLIAQSQNGTGKTLAFVLSSIIRVDPKSNDIQVIVLCPVRELATQTFDIYKDVLKYTPDIKISLIIPDMAKTALGHILVGTPKTLMNVIDGKRDKFGKLKMFIIDEADMAFEAKSDITKHVMMIYKKTNPKKQVVLFSATFSVEIMNSAKELVKEATIMKMPTQKLTLEGVLQLYVKCEPNNKFNTILDIYKKITIVQTLVFCNTRNYSEAFFNFMNKNGIKASILIGGMTPAERDATIKSFKARETSMLISTNVLARGYDNRYITFVINLDIPRRIAGARGPDTESYLHRIGRTGRFGDIGVALNIVENDYDMELINSLKSFYSCKIEETNLDKLPKQVSEIKKLREQQEAEAEENAKNK
jgi:ATP-dependent RNA helicase DDX19/DBP5